MYHSVKHSVLAALVLLSVTSMAAAQTSTPPVMDQSGSEAGNWAQPPYVVRELELRTEDRAALRRLEDRHLQELRALEDRFARELRALRAKHHQDREAALNTFRR